MTGPANLPGPPRMRYWRPAARHAALVSGYHLYSVEAQAGRPVRDVFQPAGAMLRFVFGARGNWRVQPPGGDWQTVPEVALFGPTSRVTWSETLGGAAVGLGILPRGWLHLTTEPASRWANRVGPATPVIAGEPDRVWEALSRTVSDDDVPAIFDAFLDRACARRNEADHTAAVLEGALLDPLTGSVGALAQKAGCSVRSVERLAARAFGFSPKVLLRRARFLRSLHALVRAAPADRSHAIDAGYTDYSHFVRDAQDFLGMSPQAFLRLDTPLLKQSLALRAQVLGAPAQALADPAAG